MRKLRVAGRAATVGASALLLLGIAAAPAWAATLSTTGAKGRYEYFKNGTYQMWLTDTLTDGHCAQWQEKAPGGSWKWVGEQNCTSSEINAVWLGRSTYEVRICRTGIGNCSTAVKL
ncbi:hypothetical protein [Micromonospora sp. NPDC003776]